MVHSLNDRQVVEGELTYVTISSLPAGGGGSNNRIAL